MGGKEPRFPIERCTNTTNAVRKTERYIIVVFTLSLNVCGRPLNVFCLSSGAQIAGKRGRGPSKENVSLETFILKILVVIVKETKLVGKINMAGCFCNV